MRYHLLDMMLQSVASVLPLSGEFIFWSFVVFRRTESHRRFLLYFCFQRLPCRLEEEGSLYLDFRPFQAFLLACFFIFSAFPCLCLTLSFFLLQKVKISKKVRFFAWWVLHGFDTIEGTIQKCGVEEVCNIILIIIKCQPKGLRSLTLAQYRSAKKQ